MKSNSVMSAALIFLIIEKHHLEYHYSVNLWICTRVPHSSKIWLDVVFLVCAFLKWYESAVAGIAAPLWTLAPDWLPEGDAVVPLIRSRHMFERFERRRALPSQYAWCSDHGCQSLCVVQRDRVQRGGWKSQIEEEDRLNSLSPIVRINVGGTVFETCEITLTKVSDWKVNTKHVMSSSTAQLLSRREQCCRDWVTLGWSALRDLLCHCHFWKS